MELPENTLKTKLQAGQVQHGIWLNSGSSLLAELAGQAGFDWCLIDGEHGPSTLTEILPQVQALQTTGTACVLRIPEPEQWMVKQALDVGVQTLLIPMVHNAQMASKMARAMRYPPTGTRGIGAALGRASGFGKVADYVHKTNDQMLCLVQAESAEAVANIDEIAAIEGVDGVFVGPADLSADMGYPGQPDHPEVLKAIDHLIERTVAAGKIAGTVVFDPARAPALATKGVTFLGVGADVNVLTKSLTALANQVSS